MPARLACAVMLVASALVTTSDAQSLGSFRWQLQPFCNVLTLTVVQQGQNYTLDGVDDLCGTTPARAAVRGLAYLKTDGSIGFGLTLVLEPSGAPIHLNAVIALSTLSGSWQDTAGNSGALVYNPAIAPGSPRPFPRPTFAAGLSVANARVTEVGTPTSPTDATNKAYVDAAIASAPRDGWMAVASDGSIVFRSASMAGVTVTRPPGYPTGIYCINGVPPEFARFGTMVSTQQQFSGTGAAYISVVNTMYNAVCGAAGFQFGVYMYNTSGALTNAPFSLQIPR
jgi:hypothetical protein